MAVTYTITTRISGNPREALAWALEMASYIRENVNDTVRVAQRIGGPQGQIVFASTAENLAGIEEQQLKLQDDSGYWERVDKALEKGLFAVGDTETAIWSEVG
jgi:hypothetical protein